MKLETTKDVRELMGADLASYALNAALEAGLFWRLAEVPRSAQSLADELDTAPMPCLHWLRLLAGLGLLEEGAGGFSVSPTGRSAILEAYSQESWALLAEEGRERREDLQALDLYADQEHGPDMPEDETHGDYVQKMISDPDRARRFTRMLYELHAGLGEELAASLDIGGVRRLADLGGGSGVVSMAFLRRHPGLSAVVVDIPNVCAAGREIAAGVPEGARLAYHPADFVKDELPGGFDLALECDVAIYSQPLFRKVAGALNENGRFVIVDWWIDAGQPRPASHLAYLFYKSLRDPEFRLPGLGELSASLGAAGFGPVSTSGLSNGMLVIVARKGRG
ncbi:MAG TPA: methyltransferase [Anaerolineales bacterium]